MEGDGGNGHAITVSRAQLVLGVGEPADRGGGRHTIPVGIHKIEPASLHNRMRPGTDRAGGRHRPRGVPIKRVIAGIDHHHTHRNALSATREHWQPERAGFQCERTTAGDRVEAPVDLAVQVVLLVHVDAALEIMVAVGGGEWHAMGHNRPEELREC